MASFSTYESEPRNRTTKVELTVYVPAELRTQLRIEAARTGLTMSVLVTEMIRLALHQRDVEQHNNKARKRRAGSKGAKQNGRRQQTRR